MKQRRHLFPGLIHLTYPFKSFAQTVGICCLAEEMWMESGPFLPMTLLPSSRYQNCLSESPEKPLKRPSGASVSRSCDVRFIICFSQQPSSFSSRDVLSSRSYCNSISDKTCLSGRLSSLSKVRGGEFNPKENGKMGAGGPQVGKTVRHVLHEG